MLILMYLTVLMMNPNDAKLHLVQIPKMTTRWSLAWSGFLILSQNNREKNLDAFAMLAKKAVVGSLTMRKTVQFNIT